jgi:hypothetical protein
MSELTPDQVKAFILLGMFRGRTPEPGGYLQLEISEEALVRLGDMSDIEMEFAYDYARCQTYLRVIRNHKRSELERTIEQLALAEHEARKRAQWDMD